MQTRIIFDSSNTPGALTREKLTFYKFTEIWSRDSATAVCVALSSWEGAFLVRFLSERKCEISLLRCVNTFRKSSSGILFYFSPFTFSLYLVPRWPKEKFCIWGPYVFKRLVCGTLVRNTPTVRNMLVVTLSVYSR